MHSDRQKSQQKAREMNKWVEGRETAGGRYRDRSDAENKSRLAATPVTSMMFSYVERRLDVCVFRACLASSVYQARQFVVKGHVKLNGQVVSDLQLGGGSEIELMVVGSDHKLGYAAETWRFVHRQLSSHTFPPGAISFYSEITR